MRIVSTRRFEKAKKQLGQLDQRNVEKALRKFGSNPRLPSLHLEKLQGNIYSIKFSDKGRLSLEFEGGPEKLLEPSAIVTLRNAEIDHDELYRNP